jgi:hypothetical protein
MLENYIRTYKDFFKKSFWTNWIVFWDVNGVIEITMICLGENDLEIQETKY